MNDFRSLKKPLLSQEVVQAIKQSIQDEIFKQGEKIPSERELVEQFQVSRVTIREALRNLQSSGLITIKRGKAGGAYVSEPSSDTITENFHNLIRMGCIDYSHLIDARLYIEPRAAQIAAKYRTADDVKHLHKLLESAERLAGESRREARLRNVSFHCEVSKITKNPIIVYITESITQTYSSIIINSTSNTLPRETIQKFIDQHHDILDAIVKQDPAQAFEKSRRHLLETYRAYSHAAPEIFDKAVMDTRIRQGNDFLLE